VILVADVNPLFFIICDDVRLELGGKVSIIGEFSQVQVPCLPQTVPLCVLTKWSGKPGTRGTVTLQMLAPENNTPVTIGQQPVNFAPGDFDLTYAGTVTKIPWQFQSEGLYTIRILFNGEEKGHTWLMVKKESFGPGPGEELGKTLN
jgi:hypothetical protein